MDQNKKPDWNISELYSRAWEVTQKNKILWIFGAAAAVGSGSSFRSSNFNSNDFQKLFSPNTPNNPEVPNKISHVLGIATSKPFTDTLLHILSATPLYIYLLGAMELLALIIFGLAISIVYQSWSQGMLIQGTADALANTKVTIADSAKKVLPKLKSLLWLYIVPALAFFLAILVSVLILTFTIALIPFPVKFIFLILAVIGLGAAIYWGIFLIESLIWAPREILLNNKNGKDSLVAGFKISKRKLWPMILLGLVNNILSAVIFIVPIILIIGVGGGLVYAGVKNPQSILPWVITGAVIAIPILLGFMLLGGIMTSFKATVWTDAYLKIRGKYDS